MRKLIKTMMCACICICALAIFKSDVYAATFDEDFAVVNENSCYSYAVSWSNGAGKSLKDLYPDGTKIPFAKIKTIESTENVYAFFFAYKPYSTCSYYRLYLVLASKESFSTTGSYREPINANELTTVNPVNYYNGFYFQDWFISSFCDSKEGKDTYGGVTSFIKDMPIETYDFIYNQFQGGINIKDKIISFMSTGESDECSQSSERGDDNSDTGVPDTTLGHFKIKSNKMKLINVDEHQHEHNQLTFMNETDTGVNITASNISAQYKLEGYLTEDNGETWKNHYTTPIYTASGQDFIHGKSNNQTNIYICELTPKFIDFCNHIYPISEREPFNTRKFVGKISVFVRPYHVVDGQLKYGAWTKCYARFKGSHSESGHEDGGYDNNEDSDNDSDNNYDDNNDDNYNDDGEAGVGYDDDSAEDSADSKHNDNGGSGGNSSDVSFDSIKELVNQIGNVPLLIKKVFSFLPSWCLTLIATAFVMFVMLMLVKVIRG